MKNLTFLFFLLLFQNTYSQQNLVPNGDAENYTYCPTSLGQVDAVGWFSTRESPDYFNRCTSNIVVSVPFSSTYGFQEAFSGDGFFGAQTYFDCCPYSFREFFGCQLNLPLIVGVKYYLAFRINCAFAGGAGFNLANNKIGARLTMNAYSQTNPIPVDNYSQFTFDTLITDTINWVYLHDSFVADSAYNYISFGNFHDDANTDTAFLDIFGTRAAYYFDNICLSADSNLCAQFATNTIEVFSNDIIPSIKYDGDNQFSVAISNSDDENKLRIYTMDGRLLNSLIFRKETLVNIESDISTQIIFFQFFNLKSGLSKTIKFLLTQ